MNSAQRFQPFGRRRRTRLQQDRQARVEAGHRNADRDEPVPRHLGQQVKVAQNAGGLGGDRHRMARFQADFQHLARDPIALFDGLIGIGVGAHGDRRGLVAGLGQSLAQQVPGVGLGEQLRLEVQPRREIVIGVGGPGKAVDAAVFAAAIGVDRAVERDVGRFVEADDAARLLLGHGRPQLAGRAVHRLALVQPVAFRKALGQAEAAGCVAGLRAATVKRARPFHESA
jgi:hypothetical protein